MHQRVFLRFTVHSNKSFISFGSGACSDIISFVNGCSKRMPLQCNACRFMFSPEPPYNSSPTTGVPDVKNGREFDVCALSLTQFPLKSCHVSLRLLHNM